VREGGRNNIFKTSGAQLSSRLVDKEGNEREKEGKQRWKKASKGVRE
jgi:hypothetical protein